MTAQCSTISTRGLRRRIGAAVTLSASLWLGACAQSGGVEYPSLALANPDAQDAAESKVDNRSELQKATEYWGKEYAKNPTDLKKTLNYARNLKALGQKGQALAILQQASSQHGQNRELASEYGRLALDMGQVNLAQQLLAVADDPANPDWRIVSARGTVLAKQEKFAEAIPQFEKALALSKDQPSVMNNLALAYVLNGEAPKAEAMLRQASAQDGAHAGKMRQNLALVLGLQGKYDEAKQIGGTTSKSAAATSDMALIREIVKLDPQATPAQARPTAPAVAGWSTRVTSATDSVK